MRSGEADAAADQATGNCSNQQRLAYGRKVLEQPIEGYLDLKIVGVYAEYQCPEVIGGVKHWGNGNGVGDPYKCHRDR